MQKFITVLLVLTFFSNLEAQVSMDHFYGVDAGHSYIGFEVTYMGYAKVKGRFAKFKGNLHYDPNDLKATSASFQVDATSIDTDHEWRDKDLQSANWFDVENFPAASFSSKKVISGDHGFQLIGDLTIKGVTKEVSFAMNPPSGVMADIRGDRQIIFTGYTEIDRTDYGVEGKRWSKVKEGIAAVGNQVKLEISILGKQFMEDNLSNFVRNEKSPPGMLYQIYQTEGLEALSAKAKALKQDEKLQLNVNALNIIAYLLVRKGQIDEALSIMEVNQALFPESSNVYDSLGEAYARKGKKKKAKMYYTKALELDANNMSAKEKLRYLN